jgi:hypothetical protein
LPVAVALANSQDRKNCVHDSSTGRLIVHYDRLGLLLSYFLRSL